MAGAGDGGDDERDEQRSAGQREHGGKQRSPAFRWSVLFHFVVTTEIVRHARLGQAALPLVFILVAHGGRVLVRLW